PPASIITCRSGAAKDRVTGRANRDGTQPSSSPRSRPRTSRLERLKFRYRASQYDATLVKMLFAHRKRILKLTRLRLRGPSSIDSCLQQPRRICDEWRNG